MKKILMKHKKTFLISIMSFLIIAVFLPIIFFNSRKPRYSKDDKSDAQKAVKAHLQGISVQNYTIWFSVEEIKFSKKATEKLYNEYAGSELAAANNWSDSYLRDNLIAIYARYDSQYDHTLTFLDDGKIECFFFVLRDISDGNWKVWDLSYDLEKYQK